MQNGARVVVSKVAYEHWRDDRVEIDRSINLLSRYFRLLLPAQTLAHER